MASCVALARLCHVSVTRIGGIHGLGYAASFWIVLGVAFVSEPVLTTLSFGQVNQRQRIRWACTRQHRRATAKNTQMPAQV